MRRCAWVCCVGSAYIMWKTLSFIYKLFSLILCSALKESNIQKPNRYKNSARKIRAEFIIFITVPMAQDDPKGKPHSLVCDFDRVGETMMSAFAGRQIQPVME